MEICKQQKLKQSKILENTFVMCEMVKNLENIQEDIFIITVTIVKMIGKQLAKIQKLQKNGTLLYNKLMEQKHKKK